MKKNKKQKADKKNLLGGAAKTIRKLSTTQKVMGGAALVALGLSYLSKRRGRGKTSATAAASPDAAAAEQSLASMEN